MKRNFLMHIFPLRDCQHWRASVRHLCARIDQFNGRRIVGVVTDDSTYPIAEVRAAFRRHEIELFEVPNGPLQEVETFGRQLEMIQREPGITFRCHAKGATHRDPESGSHLWRDMLFESCLDYPKLVDTVLESVPVCGPFRSRQVIGNPATSPRWHFAGSFYWFRNRDLFKRDWQKILPTFYGTESYPGERFRLEESACLFFDHAETGHLYDPDFWVSIIHPVRDRWRIDLANARLSPIVAPYSPLSDELRHVQPSYSASASSLSSE